MCPHRKAATHDSEIRHLYEEMEAQIRNEKERLLLKASARPAPPATAPPLPPLTCALPGVQDSERLQVRSLDLEHQLSSKEKELEGLFQKQRTVSSVWPRASGPVHHSGLSLAHLQLELQCRELNSEKQESYVENVKLKMTNEELSRALESTSQELSLAQEQLAMLQEQAARLHQDKEM